ncbi:hypothetical protein L1987_48105 [Smallanthus sonchifolius]|uniref:Uncharacterized protein n=1 Tax=Smallanthus sonchifolius TaxID=185202 RepID=A0ACB9FRY4_9ASTR|nr:hypothetical protein L1987_48105 [Smallanthus sonchifolius]
MSFFNDAAAAFKPDNIQIKQEKQLTNQNQFPQLYDKYIKAIKVKVPDSNEEFLLHSVTVRRNDRSAQSVIAPYDQLQSLERLFDVPHPMPA